MIAPCRTYFIMADYNASAGLSPLGEMIFEAQADGLVLVDVSGRVLAANRAARELRAIDVQRLFLGPHTPDTDLTSFFAELREHREAQADLRISGASGRARHLALRGVGGPDGSTFLIVIRDVTQERLLAAELRHLQRVESIGYLAASVVHDMGNLVTPIMYVSEALERRAGKGDLAELSSELAATARKLGGLVRQLLSFSRREAPRAQQVNVADLIGGVRPLVERVVGEDVEVLLSLEEELGDVVVDPEQLQHVLLNLAANARSAMARGGRLTLAARNVTLSGSEEGTDDCPQPGSYVALSVSDDGAGMARDVRERIFERFYTTKEEGTGGGFGLATAHRFAIQSGGCITVRSAPGQGTTVVVYLPLAPRSVRLSAPPSHLPELPRGSETVLVVDDDDGVRGVVRAALEQQGYRVVTATSARVALEQMKRGDLTIDLVLSDVVLPLFDGLRLRAELREAGQHVPVLFMSGHAESRLAHHGIHSDEHILRKPFSLTELTNRVRATLDGVSDGVAPASGGTSKPDSKTMRPPAATGSGKTLR